MRGVIVCSALKRSAKGRRRNNDANERTPIEKRGHVGVMRAHRKSLRWTRKWNLCPRFILFLEEKVEAVYSRLLNELAQESCRVASLPLKHRYTRTSIYVLHFVSIRPGVFGKNSRTYIQLHFTCTRNHISNARNFAPLIFIRKLIYQDNLRHFRHCYSAPRCFFFHLSVPTQSISLCFK